MFKQASKTRIFQDVVDQIQEAILSGSLKTGDSLPSERELTLMFNTSRGTLREALRVLEQKGLIEIKLGVGGGSIVRAVNTEQISESLALLIRSQKVSLNHLAEFREGIEGIVSASAADRATREDIEHLFELVEEARQCVEQGAKGRDAFLDADKRFHLALARISANPIYKTLIHSVHDNIHDYFDQFLSMDVKELSENYVDLLDIARAVEKGLPHEAARISREHVRRFNTYMLARSMKANQKTV